MGFRGLGGIPFLGSLRGLGSCEYNHAQVYLCHDCAEATHIGGVQVTSSFK